MYSKSDILDFLHIILSVRYIVKRCVMELQKMIGANVKAARERRKLTLDAAALLTGVSRSMLAQIEKGDVNPTISVLWKIANGYKVSFTSLTEAPERSPLHRPRCPLQAVRNIPPAYSAPERKPSTGKQLFSLS